MDKLIVCETDEYRYAVRPVNWTGIWNKKRQILESVSHLALFAGKEDAEKFVEWKEAEEQGKLLKLPCAVGEEVFFIQRDCPKDFKKEYCTDHKGSCENCHHRTAGISTKVFSLHDIPYMDTFFTTKKEAEAALKKL